VKGVRLTARQPGSDRLVECVTLTDGRELRADLIFSLYGADPNTELLQELPVRLTEKKVIDVNAKYQTSLERFYAAGDVTNHHSDQISAAVHGGAQAAQAANFVLYPARQRLPKQEVEAHENQA
jgi:thioredoxin reductase (NADPH)